LKLTNPRSLQRSRGYDQRIQEVTMQNDLINFANVVSLVLSCFLHDRSGCINKGEFALGDMHRRFHLHRQS
jgi:hypothetical protein